MIGIEVRTLRCVLSEQEVKERADTLARTVREVGTTEAAKKHAAEARSDA